MPSFQQLRFRQFLKRAAVVFVVLLITAFLYFTLQSNAWDQFTGMFKGKKNQPEEEVQDFGASDLSEFEEFLERSSVQQLILRSTELIDDESAEPLIRLDRQSKKVQIADKLLGMVDDPRAIQFGTTSKLAALRKRELINIDSGLTTPESLGELISFSQLNLTSDNEVILKQANLAQVESVVFNELINSSSSSPLSEQAFEKFKQVCIRYPDDLVVATNLLDVLEKIHIFALPVDHKKFNEAFKAEYAKSNNDKLKALAARVDQQIVESEFELINVYDSIDSMQREAAGKLRVQIENALDATQISLNGYKRLFNGVRDIAVVGEYQTAIALSEKILKKVQGKNGLQQIAQAAELFRSQVGLAGDEFKIEHVVDLNGKPFTVRHPEADIKAVYFYTSKSFAKADKYMYDIMRIANKFVADKRFCLTAIFVDRGSSKAMDEVRRVARAVPPIDFCRIDANSEEGKKALEKISMFQSPLLLLLDRENRVVGINVQQDAFEKRFFELLGNN